MKNVSSYEKRKIVEYLKSKGYTNHNNTKFTFYLDGRVHGEWERNIHIYILPLSSQQYWVWVVAELKVFQNVGDSCDYIHVQRNITCLEDIQFMEQSMDKLLDMRAYFFNIN